MFKIFYLVNFTLHPWLAFTLTRDLVTAEPTKNEFPWSFSPTTGDDYVKKLPRTLMEISEFINYEVSMKSNNLSILNKLNKRFLTNFILYF